MTLSASKTVGGQDIDIVVNYDPKEKEVVEVLEICINKVDVSPSLSELGAEDTFIDIFDWADIYHDHINQFNHF